MIPAAAPGRPIARAGTLAPPPAWPVFAGTIRAAAPFPQRGVKPDLLPLRPFPARPARNPPSAQRAARLYDPRARFYFKRAQTHQRIPPRPFGYVTTVMHGGYPANSPSLAAEHLTHVTAIRACVG